MVVRMIVWLRRMVVRKSGSVDDGRVALVKAAECAGGSGVDVDRALAEVVESLPQSKGMDAEDIIGGSKCEGWWW